MTNLEKNRAAPLAANNKSAPTNHAGTLFNVSVLSAPASNAEDPIATELAAPKVLENAPTVKVAKAQLTSLEMPMTNIKLSPAHLSAANSNETRGLRRSARSNTSRVSRYGDTRAFWSDSILERKVGLLYAADRDVKEVRGQPDAIHFRDLDGKLRKHTFDFLITYHDGTRKYVFCKYMDSVKRNRWDLFVKLIASQMTKKQADAVVIMTEQDVDPVYVDTAELFLQALRAPVSRNNEALVGCLAAATGPMTIRDIADIVGDLQSTYWQAIYSLYQGVLEFDRDRRIDVDTPVWIRRQRDGRSVQRSYHGHPPR